jgi:hypothetical protein
MKLDQQNDVGVVTFFSLDHQKVEPGKGKRSGTHSTYYSIATRGSCPGVKAVSAWSLPLMST